MRAFYRVIAWLNRRLPLSLFALSLSVPALAQSASLPTVRVVRDDVGTRLQVNGRDMMVYGMNWDYFPIGTNYTYSLWAQSDAVIVAALDREMPLLQAMGVNAIRQYVGISPRWVQYIYERYGIFTIMNHPMARYGFTLDGVWIPAVDYSDPRLRDAVKSEILQIVSEFQNTPGVLMWLLGNENNYGLSWSSFEIEALPEGERNAVRARFLYSLFDEITRAIQAADSQRPVAIANGDVQYIDIIAEECQTLDVFGTNVYRGISARDLYDVVEAKLGIPVFFTEFGADAFNAKDMREDQTTQCRYLLGQWQEIYEQSAGKGRVGNAIGGLIFQWTDGWWKFRQEENLDIHDINASWPNGGYREDYVEGDNNMNEEWWGITAKGPSDQSGLYQVYPRAAYYGLQRAFRLDAYAPTTDLAAIAAHFATIHPTMAALEARGNTASLSSSFSDRVRLSGLRLEVETYSTGGSRISTPDNAVEGTPTQYPAFLGFDHMESVYADIEARPTDAVIGQVSVNLLGHVPENPIDEIFYENRGLPVTVQTDGDPARIESVERVKLHHASVAWEDRWFRLNGFYRKGHFHWGYEGDFFGLYREAYYGENIDIYNGEAPLGMELEARRSLSGLKIAYGPQLWWGANPATLVKYRRQIGAFDATAVFQEDLDDPSATTTSSIAVPVPTTRKGTIHVASSRGRFRLELGGIWSGSNKVGDGFQIYEERAGDSYVLLQDEVRDLDALGGKAKLSFQRGRWNWYAQGAYMGVVADGGPTQTVTYTGWRLKDSGMGNQANFLSGLAANYGSFQIGPNFLWQRPLVGPIPGDVASPGRPRNVLDDPFAVRANREMIGTEILLSYDPTPATWMWQWDGVVREDAPLAGSLSFIHRHMPTTQDASIGLLSDGQTTFAFPGAPPARDLWEISGRLLSRINAESRMVANFFAGTGEPNGDDTRLVSRYGGDARITWKSLAVETVAKFNDWGPYDYHRDFNNTFPMQLMGDISHTLGTPRWFGVPQTRMGIRATYRTLNRYSPRYCPTELSDGTGGGECDPTASGYADGTEWEIRSYLHFAL